MATNPIDKIPVFRHGNDITSDHLNKIVLAINALIDSQNEVNSLSEQTINSLKEYRQSFSEIQNDLDNNNKLLPLIQEFNNEFFLNKSGGVEWIDTSSTTRNRKIATLEKEISRLQTSLETLKDSTIDDDSEEISEALSTKGLTIYKGTEQQCNNITYRDKQLLFVLNDGSTSNDIKAIYLDSDGKRYYLYANEDATPPSISIEYVDNLGGYYWKIDDTIDTTVPASIQGPPGAQGPQGPQGPQGIRGPRGYTGEAGKDGLPGTSLDFKIYFSETSDGTNPTETYVNQQYMGIKFFPAGSPLVENYATKWFRIRGDVLYPRYNQETGKLSWSTSIPTQAEQAQYESGILIKGEKGDKGDKGDTPEIQVVYNNDTTGDATAVDKTVKTIDGKRVYEYNFKDLRGPKGEPFTYSDFTSSQLSGLKGEKGDPPKIKFVTNSVPADDEASINYIGEPSESEQEDGYTHRYQINIPKGAKGDKGDRGDTGVQGEQGPQGVQGDKGDQGVQGEQGTTYTPTVSSDGWLSWSSSDGTTTPDPIYLKGPKGEQGEQGPKGDKGDTGPTGSKGDKGDEGPQGPQGIPGPQGDAFTYSDFTTDQLNSLKGVTYKPTISEGWLSWTSSDGSSTPSPIKIVGAKGETGPQGPQGLQGPKGDTGATGSKGEQGPQGIQGPKGDTGAQGKAFTYNDFTSEQLSNLKGVTYTPSISEGWLSWTSSDGSTTPSPIKIVGAKGDKGDKGDTGPKGDKGDTGATGSKGDQGAVGPKGDKGDTGIGISNVETSKIGSDTYVKITLSSGSVTQFIVKDGNKGEKGSAGPEGKSAYDLWKDAGNSGSIDVFLSSLKGDRGADGTSVNIKGTAYAATTFSLTTVGSQGAIYSDSGLSTQITGGANDAYLIDGKLVIYISPGLFQYVGSIQGPKGDTGETGATGEQGSQGYSFAITSVSASEATTPSATLVKADDTDDNGFNSTTNRYEYKLNLGLVKGDTGATGATGADGEQGIQGPKGTTWYYDLSITAVSSIGTYCTNNNITPLDGDFFIYSGYDVAKYNGTSWESTGLNLKGADGAQGSKGDTGATGAQGEQGIQGIQGVQGYSYAITSISVTEATTPTATLEKAAGTDSNGLNTTNKRYEYKLKLGLVKGSKGDTGATGAQGPKGSTWYYNLSTKSVNNIASYCTTNNITPLDGDYFIYSGYGVAKYSGSNSKWENTELNLKGADGSQGEQGLKGDTGEQGEQGIQGPQGAQGYSYAITSVTATESTSTTATLEKASGTDSNGLNSTTNRYEYKLKLGLVKGAKGDTGEQGEQGPKGSTWYYNLDTSAINNIASYCTTNNITPLDGDYFIYSGYNVAKYSSSNGWESTGLNLKGADGSQGEQGETGDNISLRKSAGEIQWKLSTADDSSWTSLISISDITGPQGEQGDPGTGINVKGTLTSLTTLYSKTAALGDCYVVAGNLYVCTAPDEAAGEDRWTNCGQIKGEQGEQGPQGPVGNDGADGVTFTPAVSSEGVLSWTASDGTSTIPSAVNIKGPRGRNIYLYSFDAPYDETNNEWTDSVTLTNMGTEYKVGDLIICSKDYTPDNTALNSKGLVYNISGVSGSTLTLSCTGTSLCGPKGSKGDDGIGISSITQAENGDKTKVTFTLSDSTKSVINIPNGVQGAQGDRGNKIVLDTGTTKPLSKSITSTTDYKVGDLIIWQNEIFNCISVNDTTATFNSLYSFKALVDGYNVKVVDSESDIGTPNPNTIYYILE